MIVQFLSWWLASLAALICSLTRALARFASRTLVIEVTQQNETVAFVRHRGRRDPISLGAAARLAARLPVVLCPAANSVLTCRHSVPLASRRDAEAILYHELSRVTPFAPEELFWHWQRTPYAHDSGRMLVTLTMVPRVALQPALATLGRVGITPDMIELERRPWPLRLPLRKAAAFPRPVVAALATVCIVLAAGAAGLPVLLQSRALARTEDAIAALRPALREVQALREQQEARRMGQAQFATESQRVGDPLSILAALNRAMPDDCYLTNLALQARQLTLSGRSPSAAHLITVLAADPAIRDPAFAAPVLRGDGSAGDVFLIRASVAP